MKSFKVLFDPESRQDLQEAITWYNHQKKGLGTEFYYAVREEIERLRLNPFFQYRYDNVRCVPVRRFPFMIHFTVEEEKGIVVIRAIFNTSLDPSRWKGRG